MTPEVLGKGFGLKLAQIMIEEAQSARVKGITLDSTITAHAFYQRLGFVDLSPMQQQDIGGFPVSYFPIVLELK